MCWTLLVATRTEICFSYVSFSFTQNKIATSLIKLQIYNWDTSCQKQPISKVISSYSIISKQIIHYINTNYTQTVTLTRKYQSASSGINLINQEKHVFPKISNFSTVRARVCATHHLRLVFTFLLRKKPRPICMRSLSRSSVRCGHAPSPSFRTRGGYNRELPLLATDLNSNFLKRNSSLRPAPPRSSDPRHKPRPLEGQF